MFQKLKNFDLNQTFTPLVFKLPVERRDRGFIRFSLPAKFSDQEKEV